MRWCDRKQRRIAPENSSSLKVPLEVQLQPKLKLSWIERGGRTTKVATVACSLIEALHVVDERRCGGLVEAVEEIEPLRNYFESQLLPNRNHSRNTHINRHESVRNTNVSTQTAARKDTTCNQGCTTYRSRNTQRTVGQNTRSVRLVRLVVVCVLIAENIERPSRRHFHDWRHSKVGQEPVETIAGVPRAGRGDDATENEPMSLIKQRVGAFCFEVAIVLWQQKGLQVRRIVDRVGPCVRRKELEVMREALLEI